MRENKPRVLVLSGEGRFTKAVANYLSAREFDVTDAFDGPARFDAVVTDAFFLRAGLAEYCRGMFPEVPIILLLEKRKNQADMHACLSAADEVVLLPSQWRGDMRALVMVLDGSRYLRLLSGAGTGTSLWDALHAAYQLSLG